MVGVSSDQGVEYLKQGEVGMLSYKLSVLQVVYEEMQRLYSILPYIFKALYNTSAGDISKYYYPHFQGGEPEAVK